ncbi:hypothetical protein B0H21DRAFT_363002 [Amylocystis lapponica]|nr:hypothetical protein B0H21DRAFT_363002 [Amylocystis lapponica]
MTYYCRKTLNVLQHAEAEKYWKLLPAPLGTALEDVCETARYSLNSCPHELWVVLDLDDSEWRRYSKFTLRISWPASSPADFSIDIFSPDALEKFLKQQDMRGGHAVASHSSGTRRQFARIRLVDTGVRTPSSATDVGESLPEPVPFIVLLEPLYLGVLPATVAPILLFLVLILSFTAVVVVPFINRYLSTVVHDARAELATLVSADQKPKSL